MSRFKSHSGAVAGGDSARSSAADMIRESADRKRSEGVDRMTATLQQSYFNHDTKQDMIADPAIRGKIDKELGSGRYRAIMPMYRDMAAVNTVKYMIEALGDPQRVTVVNGGSPEDEVAKAVAGLKVEVLQVGDLRPLVPQEKLRDLLAWDERDKNGNVKIPVGKGMSIFWLHLYDEVVRAKLPEETVTLQIDSDIGNIGMEKYNPIYYLVLPWVVEPTGNFVHTKTASPGRNNEPMMAPRNALHALEDAGIELAGTYARFTQRLKWMLTGEFAFGNRSSIRNMPHTSGYGAETILAMYLALLEQKGKGDTAQVAIRVPRLDASNTYEKEYVMYDQLTYLILTLTVRPGKAKGSLEAMPPLDELTADDAKEINARMARRDHFTVLGEDDGPCKVIPTVNDRIIPSIAELERAGYVDEAAVKKFG